MLPYTGWSLVKLHKKQERTEIQRDVKPRGSKYREYRQRTPSEERRAPKVAQPGIRQRTSPGRKPGSSYKVHTVSVEDHSNSHLNSDEYNRSKDVFSGQNLYTSPDFALN